MQDTSTPPAPRWTLRNLPLAARLCLSAFLISVGLGYLSALVNLHFAEATPAEILPTEEDVVSAYSGKSKVSQWERLLRRAPVAAVQRPGEHAVGVRRRLQGGRVEARVKKKAKALNLNLAVPKEKKQAEAAAQAELDGERLSLIAWVKAGRPDRKAYEDDAFVRSGNSPPSRSRRSTSTTMRHRVKIKSIIDARCVNCHSEEDERPRVPNTRWTNFEDITHYTDAEKNTGKSLPKLAVTTHTHLLSFSMLYGLTGLILALSSCPAWVRVPVAPLALVASVVDVAFWWLARMEEPYGPMFAKLIPVTGAVLAVALLLQIVLSLFSMFGNAGKVVLLLLFVGAGAGGYVVNERFIEPHILHEKEMMKAVEE